MTPQQRAELALAGLSVGDALGERFFGPTEKVLARIAARELPPSPWRYTDDTEMALSVVSVLGELGRIDPDTLAARFAARYDSTRGYGGAAHGLLQAYQRGVPWHSAAYALFDGSGSHGNGAAMRVAPVGAFFAEDLAAAKENATLSAVVTHTNPEGIAGAIAVAVAAALAWRVGEGEAATAAEFLSQIVAELPESETRVGVERAIALPRETPVAEVADQLGSGQRISSQDTVPFALWCAAQHLGSYEEGFWTTVRGLGDRDTTCAMVGGILALSDRAVGIPQTWLDSRESLPDL